MGRKEGDGERPISVRPLTKTEVKILERVRLESLRLKAKKVIFTGKNKDDKKVLDILRNIQLKGFIAVEPKHVRTLTGCPITGIQVELL